MKKKRNITEIEKMPPEVARKLGWYVYIYSYPKSKSYPQGKTFYVGRGKRKRALAHLYEEGDSHKVKIIKRLKNKGQEPDIEILAHQLPTEECAIRVETAIIDLLGIKELSNRVKGYKSKKYGRASLEQLKSHYAAKPVKILEPSVLIRPSRLFGYEFKMSETEIYHITRGVWKMGKRRESARYAFAVYEDVVKGVYEIEDWYPAGTTEYPNQNIRGEDFPGRWEFTGKPAPKKILNKYINRSVRQYYKKGARNPIRYVNC